MFRLVATMRRGSASGLAAAWARYPTIEAARLGTATLLRDDRILRVMIVRNEVPQLLSNGWTDETRRRERAAVRVRCEVQREPIRCWTLTAHRSNSASTKTKMPTLKTAYSEEPLARITLLIEGYRATKRRQLPEWAMKLWRRAQADRRLDALLESPPERVH
jgi:hypothetical protein